ncbi:hypothetical protein ACVWWQ_001280 [Rhodanobacter sp. TND4EL1]
MRDAFVRAFAHGVRSYRWELASVRYRWLQLGDRAIQEWLRRTSSIDLHLATVGAHPVRDVLVWAIAHRVRSYEAAPDSAR